VNELEILRETARALIEREAPIGRVRELGDAHDALLWRRIVEAGWLSMALPESSGGQGAGLGELSLVAEELGRGLASSAFLPTVLVARALAGNGAEALEAIIAGEAMATVCLAEPDAGWDPSAMQTRADGRTITGRKTLVPGASHARFLVVSAMSDAGGALFLVSSGGGGVEVRESVSMDLTRSFAEVTFNSAPAQPIRGGAAAVTRLQDEGAALICAETVGASAKLLEAAVAYARERTQFGRPIGSFQAVKHRCANMLIALEASRAATDVAVRSLDASTSDASQEVSAAKAYAGEACARLAADALQVHGGIGFTWELDVHLYLRRIRSNRALFGTPSWHRDRLYGLIAS
jgi:alkylation response protein AidB-like acyl-CoA dehydrogenase